MRSNIRSRLPRPELPLTTGWGVRAAFMAVSLTGLLTVSPAVAQQPDLEEAPWIQDAAEVGVDARRVIGDPAGEPLSGDALAARTDEISSDMRCPVCQGLSVADSPSKSAVGMKTEVRELLSQGYTKEQILLYFEQAYGEFVLLKPKAEGFNLVVWIAPVAAILLGLVVVFVRVRRKDTRQNTRQDTPREDTARSSDEDTAREGSAPQETPQAPPGDPGLAAYLEQVRREVKTS